VRKSWHKFLPEVRTRCVHRVGYGFYSRLSFANSPANSILYYLLEVRVLRTRGFLIIRHTIRTCTYAVFDRSEILHSSFDRSIFTMLAHIYGIFLAHLDYRTFSVICQSYSLFEVKKNSNVYTLCAGIELSSRQSNRDQKKKRSSS
jgi:hypothetical protein